MLIQVTNATGRILRPLIPLYTEHTVILHSDFLKTKKPSTISAKSKITLINTLSSHFFTSCLYYFLLCRTSCETRGLSRLEKS